MAKFLFSPRKTSCYPIDLRSAISLGRSKDCSTASTTYPAVPCWKSWMEASLRRGAQSSSMRGSQTGVAARWSTLFSPLSSSPRLRLLGPLLGLDILGRLVLPNLYHLFPFLFLLPFVVGWINLEGLSGWKSGEVGLRSFPRSISPWLGLQQLLEGWPRPALDAHINRCISRFLERIGLCWGRKAEITRKVLWGQNFIEEVKFVFGIEYFHYFFLFFFFFLYEGWMRRSSLLGCMLWWLGDLRMPSCIGLVASVPCGTGPIMRSPKAATLILCRRGSLALIMHFGAWNIIGI